LYSLVIFTFYTNSPSSCHSSFTMWAAQETDQTLMEPVLERWRQSAPLHRLNPAAGDWAAPQIANTALGRYGHVDEVAALVAFVASPEASYITGANLTLDGGTNA
jgi:NAD(P)-dependent dehydrogenase (short-subunit alcohol dehydrogenase family)